LPDCFGTAGRLWFPKIRSGLIRAVRQNQRIIAFDAGAPPLASSIYRQSLLSGN